MARWILVTARGQRACFSRGISGRIAAERVAESAWNQWPNARGMGGRIGVEYAGGLVNDPKDPGGVTKFGISQRSYPNLNIRELTPDDAKAIYQRDYWAPIQGEALPAGLDLLLLDHAVNAGPARAVRLLQSLVNVPEDGLMGPVTLGEIASADPQDLIELGVLLKAKAQGLIPSFGQAVARMQANGIYLSLIHISEPTRPY